MNIASMVITKHLSVTYSEFQLHSKWEVWCSGTTLKWWCTADPPHCKEAFNCTSDSICLPGTGPWTPRRFNTSAFACCWLLRGSVVLLMKARTVQEGKVNTSASAVARQGCHAWREQNSRWTLRQLYLAKTFFSLIDPSICFNHKTIGTWSWMEWNCQKKVSLLRIPSTLSLW